MTINYDPDARPNPDPAMIREAARLGRQIVHVLCDEPEAKVGDHTGVSFFAIVSFIPRAGDRIILEDGKVCGVRVVDFKVESRKAAEGTLTFMDPNVYAVLLKG
jgi:hypothetical protein